MAVQCKHLPPHQCTLYISGQIELQVKNELLTITPAKDIRYVNLFPYCSANGCQNRRPHPMSRNKYPVPSFRVLTETPVL